MWSKGSLWQKTVIHDGNSLVLVEAGGVEREINAGSEGFETVLNVRFRELI